MRKVVPGILLIVVGLLGACREPPAAPTKIPQADVRAIGPVTEPGISPGDIPTTACTWELTVVQIPEHAIEEHGIGSLFEGTAETNSVITNAIFQNTLIRLARGDSNILLRISAGVYPGLCSDETASNLLAKFKSTAGTEVLAMPLVKNVGTNQSQVYVGNNLTVFTGASSNSSRSTPFITNLSFGHAVMVQLERLTKDRLTVHVAASNDRFGGYQRDHADWYSQFMINHSPIFHAAIMGTRAELATNEVLLLGSVRDFSVITSVDRVPKLSRLPAIGRLFTKVRVQTNFFRTIIMVKPRLANGGP